MLSLLNDPLFTDDVVRVVTVKIATGAWYHNCNTALRKLTFTAVNFFCSNFQHIYIENSRR